jgi:hopanoid biosynthesis associated protein HpnK
MLFLVFVDFSNTVQDVRSRMKRQVIINADDFGLCDGVNRGILKAHRQGVLTSATLMANMPGAEQAVQIAKDNPSLGVGVHLTLTEGQALTPAAQIPSLADAKGQFLYRGEKLAMLSIIRPDIRKAIYRELNAQVRWVLDHGIKPTHLDSHKHIHCFPPLYTLVCRIAKQYQISAIRRPFEPKNVGFAPWPQTDSAGRKRAGILRILTRINRLQNPAYIRNQALFGIAHTGAIDFSFLEAVCRYNTTSPVEIMTHPGFCESLDRAKTRLIEQRESELESLCDSRVKDLFRQENIELTHYGSI